MDITDIIEAIQIKQIRITDHADEEAQADKLSLEDIYYSVCHGEIIEDYPMDRPYPSCLILGSNTEGNPIHSVWAYNHQNGWVALITVYRPDPNRWINWRERRNDR
jgi:hypothetical protein